MAEQAVGTAFVWSVLLLGMLVAIASCVLLHYAGLLRLSQVLGRMPVRRRTRPLYAVFALIALHVVEILIFALVGYVLEKVPGVGEVVGTGDFKAGGFSDVFYLSAVSFTTIGFGEMVPVGHLRSLFAIEGLIGLTLITWSASFTYLEMERDWRR